jgi:hypothetical protein
MHRFANKRAETNEIFQLPFEGAVQLRARAGMVQRHQPPAIPAKWHANITRQPGLMRGDQPERIERDRAERDHDGWLDEINRGRQKVVAVLDFVPGWFGVPALHVSRIAEDGVRHEDVVAGESSRIQESLEISPGLIT